MGSSGNNTSKDILGFFKIIGTLVGTLGGFAALFVVFGYITLLSFLTELNIYGLVYFTLQFYKEANIAFLKYITQFYSKSATVSDFIIAILIIVLPILLPKLFKGMKIFKIIKQAGSTLILLFTLFVVFVTFKLDLFTSKLASIQPGERPFIRKLLICLNDERLFYVISLPVLLALFFYLADNFGNINLKKPFNNLYFPFLLILIALFISIPIGYGSYLYDMQVFPNIKPEFIEGAKIEAFEQKIPLKLYYIMGHTSEKEIFIDAAREPYKIIIVDKKLINSVRINYIGKGISLRGLLTAWKKGEKEDFSEIIYDTTPYLEKSKIDEWSKKEAKK